MVGDVEQEDDSQLINVVTSSHSGNQYNILNYKKKKTSSLADSWRWVKGLLYDFIALKKENAKNVKCLEQANRFVSKFKNKRRNNSKSER